MPDHGPVVLIRTGVAWPTVVLATACLAGWTLSFWAGASSRWPWWASFLTAVVCAYAIYIAVHDAAHGAVTRQRTFNEWLGRIGILLLTPFISFSAYRYLHLQHHRATNEAGADPDMWAGRGPSWALPLRLLTIDLGYYGFYLRRLSQRPASEILEGGISLLVGVSSVVALILEGLGREILLFWILPGRMAIFVLAWVLDYLPHRPYRVAQRDNPFQATNIRVGSEAWLSPLMLWQNYHLVHHLYPRAPFWQTVRLWRQNETWHLEQGPALVSLLGRTLTVDDYYKIEGLSGGNPQRRRCAAPRCNTRISQCPLKHTEVKG